MAYSFLGKTADAFATTLASTISGTAVYTGGERVVIPVCWNSNGTDTLSLSDGTNSYSVLGKVLSSAGQQGAQYLALAECKNAVAGTYTLTATIGGGNVNFRGLVAYRYSGLSSTASAVYTGQSQAAPGTGADAVSSGLMTPGSAPAMVFGGVLNGTDTAAPSTGTGFTGETSPTTWLSGQCGGVNFEDKRITTTSSVAATFTSAAGTETYQTAGLVIPEAGGSSVKPSQFFLSGLLPLYPLCWVISRRNRLRA